jgi:hypothetical protein
LFYKDVIRQFWQEKLSAVFTEMSFVSFGRKRSSEKLVYLCHGILVVGEQRTWGAFSTPFLLLKMVIFVLMNKNYLYVALGVAVLIGGYFLIKPKNPAVLPEDVIDLDKPTMQTIIAYLYDRGYNVEQLPEDIKARLTSEQIASIKEALANYKP